MIYLQHKLSIILRYIFMNQVVPSLLQPQKSSVFIQGNQKKSTKYFFVLLLFIFSFFKVYECVNTIPIAWSYQPTLIQCGKFIIPSPSDSTVPPAGKYYTITFKRLINPTIKYKPALGFVDLSYLFTYNQGANIRAYSFIPTSTSFIIDAWGLYSSNKLTRYSINYLAVSNDLTDFFIWIDFIDKTINQQLNSTDSFTSNKSLSQALPITSNINYIISISFFDLSILEPSPHLFDYQIDVNIINATRYNFTVSSPSARINVMYSNFFVIFYQQVTIPYQQTLLIPYLYNFATASSSTEQMVYPNQLIDSFEVNSDNSFFAPSRLSALLKPDFTVNYLSNISMSIAFNQTKVIKAHIFIYRQLPDCPPYYILNSAQMVCVCNSVHCYEGIGCSSATAIGTNTNCLFCSIIDNFVIDSNGNCVCKTGYQLNNETCEQICGDGIKFKHQCDDGNNVSGDGCSSQCTIQNSFQCTQNSIGTLICVYKQNICFNITKIEKNDDNSAIFTFQTIGKSLPLPFSTNDFEIGKTLNLTISRNDSTNCAVNYSINKIYNQTMQILVNFQQTIEGYSAVINFNFNSTKYLSQDCTLNFVCKGSEMPLIFSKNSQQYKMIGKVNLVFICLLGIIFIVSMLAPKWIGVEVMQVNQLIFFSQLLITDASNWPIAFQVFKYFKYSNGFNNIFLSQTFQTFPIISKKWKFLEFQPFFIFNFSINFLLIVFFLILYFLLRPNEVVKQKQQQQPLISKKKTKIKDSQQPVSNQSKTERKLYQLYINVAVWSMLQFLAAFVSHLELFRYFIKQYDFVVPLQVNGLLIVASLFIILFTGGNLLGSLILSKQTIRVLQRKPQLQKYKKVNFFYHFFLGISIFSFRNFEKYGVPISGLFFIAQILYIIYIYRLRPYKQCIRIHSVGCIFNRFGYLIFLGFITLKNVFINMSEVIMLAMCYFVVAFTFIMILLSIIRLYYDLRFGQEYQKKMEDIRKGKQLEQKIRKKLIQEQELEQIRQEARKKKLKNDSRQMRNNNKYRIESIVLQEQQIELLQFLDKKNWSKSQKEKYYYQRYTEKPLIWLQKHDRKEYQLRMNQAKQQKSKSKSKKKLSEKDEMDKKELQRFKRERRQELKEKKEKQQSKSKSKKKINEKYQMDKNQLEKFKRQKRQELKEKNEKKQQKQASKNKRKKKV